MDLNKVDNSIVLKGDKELHALCAGESDTNLINVITTELYYLLDALCNTKKITIYCFTSEGFDLLAAKTVLELKLKYPTIELVTFIANDQIEENGNLNNESTIKQLLISSDTVEFIESSEYNEFTDTIINNVSAVIAYCSGADTETTTLVEQAKAKGVDVVNLFDNLSDYFACNHPAKLLMQTYPNASGFRYSKSGIIFAYENLKPLPINFAQIDDVTCEEGHFTFTLANGLTMTTSAYSADETYIRMQKIPSIITREFLIKQGIDPDKFEDPDMHFLGNSHNEQ